MRKPLFILILVVALMLTATAVSAQVPGPGGPYNTGFTIQNLETQSTNCTFNLYNGAGVSQYQSAAISVAGSGSYFVYVGNLSISSGQYSAVIACDRQVAAVANTTGAASAASYSGVDAADVATVLYAPGVYKGYYGYTSNIVVQNTTSGVINITLQIFAPGNSTPIASYTESNVPANASVNFDQAAEAFASGLYSAKITGTGAIAAAVNIWNAAGQLYSYNPFAGGGSVAYAPVLMNNYYSFNTALTVQNLSASATQVRVTYSNGATNTQNIAGSSSLLFYTPNEGLPSGWLGSAKVEILSGSGPIVALVNESSAQNRAASYNGFTEGATTANAPIVLKTYYGYSTSITCQNVGGSAANISVTYSNGASETLNNIPANGTALFYQPNTAGLPASFNGSAIITSAQPIVCVVNENQVSNPALQDWLLAYNGIQ
jgi:hypothetical protein